MAKVPVGLRFDPEMIDAIDAARGDVSRVRWIERAIESALRIEPHTLPPIRGDVAASPTSSARVAEFMKGIQ